jgi:ribosomal protein S8
VQEHGMHNENWIVNVQQIKRGNKNITAEARDLPKVAESGVVVVEVGLPEVSGANETALGRPSYVTSSAHSQHI